MSDITDTRKAQEHLLASDVDPDPKLLMKAAIYASLSSARALRELDGTTHRTSRLVGDSVDELRDDLRSALNALRKRAFISVGDGYLVNLDHVTALVHVGDDDDHDNATQTEIWLDNKSIVYSRTPVNEIMSSIGEWI